MKKLISIFSLLLIVTMTFASCGTKNPSENPSEIDKTTSSESFNSATAQTITASEIANASGDKYKVELVGNFSSRKVESESQIKDGTFNGYQLPSVGDEILTGKFGFKTTSPDGKVKTQEFKSQFFKTTEMSFNKTKINDFFTVMVNKDAPDFIKIKFKWRDSQSSSATHLFFIKNDEFTEINFTVKESTTAGFVMGIKFVQQEDGFFRDALVNDNIEQMSNLWHFDADKGEMIWDKILENGPTQQIGG